MVVRTMSGQVLQADGENDPNRENPLDLEIISEGGANLKLPVALKTLTTTGATLTMRGMDQVVQQQIQKGQQIILNIHSGEAGGIVELPGKILWTRNHKDDPAMTLGLEMTAPLLPSIRKTLEAYIPINAKDMKVFWDCWDETNKSEVPAEAAGPGIFKIPEDNEGSPDTKEKVSKKENSTYWIGFGSILSGIVMQLPHLEYLTILGILMMFGGSIAIASKSIMSMLGKKSLEPVQ
jgi:hypothetical protein